ncbi:MAG TPA: hypothetical protein VLM75_07200 [Spirochaetota bacterium]|nr:hypothetical protein [Spirochaetota bacterium]
MGTERIDKTRKNIGAEQLNESEKKQLFNKFVEAGGKVARNQKQRALADFDRDKQKQFRSKIDGHAQKLKEVEKRPSRHVGGTNRAAEGQTAAEYIPAPGRGIFDALIRLINRWQIRIRLYSMGVCDFYGEFLTKKFLERFNTEMKSALLELQLVYLDIFKQSHKTGVAIVDELDRLDPLYYELIEMSSGVFDRGMINQIVEHHINFPHIGQKAAEIREPLTRLFKKLYVLYPYKELILLAFDRAIGMQMKLEKGKNSLYAMKRKKIKNDVAVVFNRLYTVLYWLFCNYLGELYLMKDPVIARILQIADTDVPNRRGRAKRPDARPEEDESGEPQEEAGEQDQLPEEVRKGLAIMNALDLKKLRSVYDKSGVFKYVRDNDKILLAHILFREFDEEYSFILTTNKIKYNVQFTQQGKVDYRIKLSDMYNDLRRCMSVFKDYADIIESYEKARNEKPTSNAQYIDYSNRLAGMDKKKTGVGKNVRMTVRDFMEKVIIELSTLIADMNGGQRIVDNPQDVLGFESSIEGSKKMNGRKVYEAILAAYCYASAFRYRLSSDGDLFGEEEINEEEMQKMAALAAQSESLENERDSAGEDKTKSSDEGVLKELDDLF